MQKLLLLTFLFSCCVIAVQAQEEEIYPRICTEILMDSTESDMPDLPPGMTARAVAFKPEIGKYWPNGRVLKVRFLNGSNADRSRVRRYAQEWSEVANIKFVFVEKGDSDLRVGFAPDKGTWSLIGTDARHMPQHKQTMNFSWFKGTISEADYRATVLHEFGHVLGLLHEHQHPQGGIPWDKPKLYQYYRRTQGWDQALVDQQVLGRLKIGKTQYTRYDPQSIMHYPIPNALTVGDFEIGLNKNLSPTDRAFIAKVYPKTTAPTTGTRPASTATTTTATLTIRDVLPEGQKREQVWVTIGNVTKSFVLDQSANRSDKVSFTLPGDGRYAYEVRTKTTFVRRVNGRLEETLLYGYGEGEVNVRRKATFDLAVGKAIRDHWFEVNLLTAKE